MTMADVRPCPMDCTKCSFTQHAFCAAKMMFDMSQAIQTTREQIDTIASMVNKLEEKIDSELSLPNISQEGSGEDSRLPKQIKS